MRASVTPLIMARARLKTPRQRRCCLLPLCVIATAMRANMPDDCCYAIKEACLSRSPEMPLCRYYVTFSTRHADMVYERSWLMLDEFDVYAHMLCPLDYDGYVC